MTKQELIKAMHIDTWSKDKKQQQEITKVAMSRSKEVLEKAYEVYQLSPRYLNKIVELLTGYTK